MLPCFYARWFILSLLQLCIYKCFNVDSTKTFFIKILTLKALLRSSTPQLTLLGLLWILYVGVLRGICYPLFSVYSSSYELNFEATVAPTLLLQHQKKKPTPSRTSPGTFIQKSTFNVYMATQHIKCLSSSAYEVILKAVQMRCI